MNNRIPLLLFIILLAACARMPMGEAPVDAELRSDVTWPAREQQLQFVQDWTLRGAFSIKSMDFHNNASLYWRQYGNQFKINLFGPLGVGNVQIETVASGEVLLQTDDEVYYATTPEQLITSQTGLFIPVTNLYYWIRGLPVPNLPYTPTIDHRGYLAQLEQDGWLINYPRYSYMGGDLYLPSQIRFTDGVLNIRININRWQLDT